jgi:hypothetical protein
VEERDDTHRFVAWRESSGREADVAPRKVLEMAAPEFQSPRNTFEIGAVTFEWPPNNPLGFRRQGAGFGFHFGDIQIRARQCSRCGSAVVTCSATDLFAGPEGPAVTRDRGNAAMAPR